MDQWLELHKRSLNCVRGAMAGLTQPGRSGLVAIGINASYVHVLDGEGSPVWKQPTGSPVTDLEFLRARDGALLTAASRAKSVREVFLVNGSERGALTAALEGGNPGTRIYREG